MKEPIQLLTHEYAPFRGGIARYVEGVARAAAGQGRQVTVWAPDYGAGAGTEEEGPCWTVRRVRMRGRQDVLCRARMALALKAAFPDGRIPGTVVLAEPGPIRMWMEAERWHLPCPERLVLVLHGSEIERLSNRPRRCRAFRDLLRRADRIGVVSSAVGERLLGLCPEVRGRLVRVPGAGRKSVPADEAPGGGDRQCPKDVKESGGDRLILLQVGRVDPRKGQGFLVDVLGRLGTEALGALQVRMVGPVGRWGYARQVRRRAEQLGLPVEWLGAVGEAELEREYERADVLVFPSRRVGASVEGLGLVALEAAEHGCAVVASRTGGVAEAVRDGETGLLLPEGDIEAWAAAFGQLSAEPDRVARLGAAGRSFVEAEFSWERTARRLLGP